MSFFLPNLKKNGLLESVPIAICNVGSRKVSSQDDYGSQIWGLFAPHLSIYGFDADVDACEEANAALESREISWVERHLPYALGAQAGEETLYVTKNPMCSSLYPPNEPFLARFSGLPELVNLDFTVELEITTLDSVCQEEGIERIDFLQVDVQGADLAVLQGAETMLNRSVLAIQVEVEFSPLYSQQPLFAEVDTYLRQQGFTLFDLSTAYRVRSRSPIHSTAHPGQLLWGDAFYLRDAIAADADPAFQTPDALLTLACVADALNFHDYALEVLEYLTLHHGDDPRYNGADSIVQTLAQVPQLREQGLGSLAIVANLRDRISPESVALLAPTLAST